ncbi:VCBS repeat-containing protein [Streptomyces venezuelae]|uniref:FG-GAP-like repeat-containing protein n=1 Tax=Streptomyces venezuelae TaxID=54571 RepID=UPI00123C0A14|nr:FG-GAP-like repeat-containing protein [Streptomyces venezuelae]QES09510.1 VCBS repeat-containing protein [Streptomyces venezuelae]
MSHRRRATPRSRPLTTAIATALAVTGGTLATAPAAVAGTTAPPAAVSAATRASTAGEVLDFPKASEIAGGGATGFLSRSTAGEYRWTRTDGSSTVLTSPGGPVLGAASDVVATQTADYVLQIRDMAKDAGADPVEIELTKLGGGVNVAIGMVGSRVLTSAHTVTGTEVLRVVSREADGTLLNDAVTGLPGDAVKFVVRSAVPGAALVSYASGGATRYAVVDLAAHAVVETYENPASAVDSPSLALSATHVAWVERTTGADGKPAKVVVVADRERPGATERFAVGNATGVTVGLTGSWVVYGEDATGHEGGRLPLVAEALGAGTGAGTGTGTGGDAGRELLEHATSLVTAPDGTLLVRGGSLVEGEAEGLFRVTAGADGVSREQVARSGEATQLAVTDFDVPEVLDLDKHRPFADFTFRVNRPHARVSMVISGEGLIDNDLFMWRGVDSDFGKASGPLVARWDGTYDFQNGDYGQSGVTPNGTYEWRARIEPWDGVGNPVELRGKLTVTRAPRPHDWDHDGDPDLLSVNAKGELIWNEDGHGWDIPWGTGWNIYDRTSVPGDLGGTDQPDVVARDRNGELWLYQGGTSKVPLSPRSRIGGGWQIYDKLVGGSDVDADGKADLLATDRTGVLWFYPGTGNADVPFSPRKKVGGGWDVYNEIVATGDIGGAPAGDLVARDKDGVLWLYLAKGDGTFAARTRIGGGWNAFSHLLAIGDQDNDGRNDLLAYSRTPYASGNFTYVDAYVYKGTGDWRTPFGPRSSHQAQAEQAPRFF